MHKLIFDEPIYTYHIDFVGHVNNIIYVQWLENARLKLFSAMGLSIPEVEQTDQILPIITKTEIQYKKPLYLHDSLQIETWISGIKNVSSEIKFRFLNGDGELCCVAQQQMLFIDKDSERPSRKFVKYREAFEKFLITE